MNGLIRASLSNPYAVTVSVLSIALIGALILGAGMVPVDILPVFKSPAVQVLTFYNGMPADSIEKDITNRMERWTGQAAGVKLQESRSLIGCWIIRNYYDESIDPNGALTQVNSLASAAIPNLPPGTLPPVILPFDPTGTTPVCIIALDSKTADESALYDVGRYEVRNMIMAKNGSVAPVVYGGKVRAIIAYMDRTKMQARNLSPLQVMNALDLFNIFLPTGDAKFGTTDYAINSNSMYERVTRMGDIPIKIENGKPIFLGDVANPQDAAMIQTNVVRVNGRRQVYIPVFRQSRFQHSQRGQHAQGEPRRRCKNAEPHGHGPEAGHGPVGVCRELDRELGHRRDLGGRSLLAGDSAVPRRMADDADRRADHSRVGAGGDHRPVCRGQTINVMTLAGLSLAIGPLVDSAIICLENTHRHLSMGTNPRDAAFLGASEVAMPELVASCCTLLVLAPLALMPGLGAFLFRPMALAVAFAMIVAYILSRSFVPTRCALWLRAHRRTLRGLRRRFAVVCCRRDSLAGRSLIESGIRVYVHLLKRPCSSAS